MVVSPGRDGRRRPAAGLSPVSAIALKALRSLAINGLSSGQSCPDPINFKYQTYIPPTKDPSLCVGFFGGCYGRTLWPFHHKGGNAHCSVRNSKNTREKNTEHWHRPFLSSHAALLVAMLCVDLAGSLSFRFSICQRMSRPRLMRRIANDRRAARAAE